MTTFRCSYHLPNQCPPRVDGHNQGSLPDRILDVVRMNEPVALVELRSLIPDAAWLSTRRAYARLLEAGQLRAETPTDGSSRLIYVV